MLTTHLQNPASAALVAGDTPLTRRQLREAERLSARRGVRRSSAAPTIGSSPTKRPAATGTAFRSSRRRSYASQGLSVLAMAFVTTVTVATSLPANALFSSEDIGGAPVRASVVTAAEPAQTLTVANGAVEPINRETYTVEPYEEIVVAQADGTIGTFANNPSSAIQWPFVDGVPISGTFGYRIAPCSNGCSSNHKGVDFAPGAGTPIRAIAGGVVRYVESSDYGLGVHVIIDHMIDGHLVTSVYGHMQFGSLQVSQGQVVGVGQNIGAVGNTGASTGAHLHLEIQMADGTPVDPYAWLKAHAG